MFTNTAKNAMLDAFGITHASLHNAYPGITGSGELAGGSPAYARKAISFAAAASGSKSANTTPILDVPAGSTVAWVGFWDALTAGAFRACVPNGGQEKEFSVDPATDIFRAPAHGFVANQEVVVYGVGTMPAPLVAGTVYFVRDVTTDTFKLAATAGGVAIDITAEGSYDCILSKIVRETFTAQGQHQVSSTALHLNA